MNQYDMAELVTVENGKPMTTSLKVAEVFGKQHKNVIRDIENLDCSEDFRRLNFERTEIDVQAGPVKRMSPIYRMTRDGFTFLAMGFTGSRAAEFKEKYIDAFNKMEKTLNDPVALRQRLSTLEVLEMALDAEKKRLVAVAALEAAKPDIAFVEHKTKGRREPG